MEFNFLIQKNASKSTKRKLKYKKFCNSYITFNDHVSSVVWRSLVTLRQVIRFCFVFTAFMLFKFYSSLLLDRYLIPLWLFGPLIMKSTNLESKKVYNRFLRFAVRQVSIPFDFFFAHNYTELRNIIKMTTIQNRFPRKDLRFYIVLSMVAYVVLTCYQESLCRHPSNFLETIRLSEFLLPAVISRVPHPLCAFFWEAINDNNLDFMTLVLPALLQAWQH